jgi:hypothetical protein
MDLARPRKANKAHPMHSPPASPLQPTAPTPPPTTRKSLSMDLARPGQSAPAVGGPPARKTPKPRPLPPSGPTPTHPPAGSRCRWTWARPPRRRGTRPGQARGRCLGGRGKGVVVGRGSGQGGCAPCEGYPGRKRQGARRSAQRGPAGLTRAQRVAALAADDKQLVHAPVPQLLRDRARALVEGRLVSVHQRGAAAEAGAACGRGPRGGGGEGGVGGRTRRPWVSGHLAGAQSVARPRRCRPRACEVQRAHVAGAEHDGLAAVGREALEAVADAHDLGEGAERVDSMRRGRWLRRRPWGCGEQPAGSRSAAPGERHVHLAFWHAVRAQPLHNRRHDCGGGGGGGQAGGASGPAARRGRGAHC